MILETRKPLDVREAPGLSFPLLRRADRHGDYGEVHTMRSAPKITHLVNVAFLLRFTPAFVCGRTQDAGRSVMGRKAQRRDKREN